MKIELDPKYREEPEEKQTYVLSPQNRTKAKKMAKQYSVKRLKRYHEFK